MAEQIMEDIRLLDVIELIRLANEIAGGEAAVGKVPKNTSSGTSPGTATMVQPVRLQSVSLTRRKSGI